MIPPAPEASTVWLGDDDARAILARLAAGERSFDWPADLGATSRVIRLDFAAPPLAPGLDPESLARLAALRGRIFAFGPRGPRAVEASGPPYVKLVPTGGPPTMQIDGIQMHRTEGVDPAGDTELKVRGVVRPGDRVLDTCAGLGYSAAAARARGAASVITFERSPEVLAVARWNPWSAPLFDDPGIRLVEGDAVGGIAAIADASVDAVVHDPPRFALCCELYGDDFYAALARVLRRGGRLYHYVGKPDSGYGARLFPSVRRRLAAAGFKVEPAPERFGFLAVREGGRPRRR